MSWRDWRATWDWQEHPLLVGLLILVGWLGLFAALLGIGWLFVSHDFHVGTWLAPVVGIAFLVYGIARIIRWIERDRRR